MWPNSRSTHHLIWCTVLYGRLDTQGKSHPQEKGNTSPRNRENVQLPKTYHALPNKATPFLCFLSCFWFCRKFFLGTPASPNRQTDRQETFWTPKRGSSACQTRKTYIAQTWRRISSLLQNIATFLMIITLDDILTILTIITTFWQYFDNILSIF